MDNIALFLDEYLNKIGSKKFESTEEFITYKKGTFNIRLDAFLYKDKDTLYFAYIYPTNEKLLINVKVEPISKEDLKSKDGKELKSFTGRIEKIKERIEKGDLKLIVGENIIGQLARMAVMGLKNNWILIILIGVVCGLAGGGIAYGVGLNNGISQGFNQAQLIINATMPSPLPVV